MNKLQELISTRGLSLQQVADATGIKYSTVFRHADGSRNISGEMAVLYERGLGVPRAELRPDLFGDLPPAVSRIYPSGAEQ